jgi:hypothetical protein
MTRTIGFVLLLSTATTVAYSQDPPPPPRPSPFQSCRPSGAPRPIVDGTYFLISASNPNFCLDSATDQGGKIQTFNCNGGVTQYFNFGRRDAANCYAVQVISMGQSDNAAFLFGTVGGTTLPTIAAETVGLFPIPPISGGKDFRWDVQAVPNKPGVFYVVSTLDLGAVTQLCLTAESDTLPGHDAGNEVCNGVLRQEWKFQLIAPTPAAHRKSTTSAQHER